MNSRALTVGVALFVGAARCGVVPATGPGASGSVSPARAQGLLRAPLVVEQPRLEFQRRQQAPDPGRDDRARGPRRGPGVVTHMWITIADNEYGWPRLLRLRVYYDGSPTPSVDAPVGDFFAVGHGFEARVKSLMIVDSSDGRARNSYWPMPFQKSCRDHDHQRGPAPRREPLLPRGLGEAAVAAGEHAATSTRATGRRCRRPPTASRTSS